MTNPSCSSSSTHSSNSVETWSAQYKTNEMNTNMINKTNNIKTSPFKHIMSITKTNRIISVIITLLWTSVIFSFSLQPAEASSEISIGVGRWILEHLLPGLVQRFDSMPQEQLDFLHTLLRKAGHFSEFFVLGILSMITARQMKIARKKMVPFLFCVLVAAMDETIQLFVSGRSGQVSDVILDSVGAVCGVLFLTFLFSVFKVDFSPHICYNRI